MIAVDARGDDDDTQGRRFNQNSKTRRHDKSAKLNPKPLY